jgi:CheY-like chemotaxis protein
VAAALLSVLEALGCVATHVESAAAAREWLAAQQPAPDLVLTDVMMSGDMDGIALAQSLRENMPGLPVLLMTGYAQRIDAATRLGFEVLPKPCSPEVLSAAIARATAGSPRREGNQQGRS